MMNDEQRAAFDEWLVTRPAPIQVMARRFPPNSLWILREHPEAIYTPRAYAEDGTIRMLKYEVVIGAPLTEVFGMHPEDFEPCTDAIAMNCEINGVNVRGFVRA